MADLLLHEQCVQAALDEVRNVGPPQRVEVEAGGEAEFIAVPTEPSENASLGDEAAPLGREQVELTTEVGVPVLQPIGEHLGRPVKHGQHASALRW